MADGAHLLDVDDLADLLDSPSLRIADVRWYLGEPDRGRREYEAAHIPGAVFVDLDRDLSLPEGPGRHPMPPPEDIADRLGALGFGDDHQVVAYDASGGAVAARMWWMLRSIGHPSVRVLDGGIDAWNERRGPTASGVEAAPPATLTVRAPGLSTIDRDALEAALGSVIVIDVRAPERYRGDVEPVDPKAGHVPTAVNVPFAENLAADGRFLPPHLLAARYRAVAPDGDAVVYCGSGVNACHTALAMAHAGLDLPTLYPGSWSDWSSSDLPVETDG